MTFAAGAGFIRSIGHFIVVTIALFCAKSSFSNPVDLLARYPTMLTDGDLVPANARQWHFTDTDIYSLTRFEYVYQDRLTVITGPADLGIGHTSDGAVWAVIVPQQDGTVTSPSLSQPETVSHVWLRFHPKIINNLFPPETVDEARPDNSIVLVRRIADHKFVNSFHAGPNAMIPPPGTLVFDIDTAVDRRFFVIQSGQATDFQYIDAFQGRSLPAAQPVAEETALGVFDQIWNEFDQSYAMFVIRPGVDWNALREEFRPKAEAARDKFELAYACADMLRNLKDLHVWLTVDGGSVPVYSGSVFTNANPAAYPALVGEMQQSGNAVQWGRTNDNVGFIAIHTWTDQTVPGRVDTVLEELRDTDHLIVDVRLNGGGSEDLAQQVAGRFTDQEYVYALSQFRSGPLHTDLTEKFPRTFAPRGGWRYEKPVIVLIGQRCISSNEAFIKMMDQCPQVTLMGDRTRGSSGNPKIVELPLNMTVSVPRWIDYLADGQPLEGRGITPDVSFIAPAEAFSGERDELLSAALDRFRNAEVMEFQKHDATQ